MSFQNKETRIYEKAYVVQYLLLKKMSCYQIVSGEIFALK